MTDATKPAASSRLSGEDLTFWWADTPQQPTTMAMLMLLSRSPDEARLRRAFERAVAAVPRLSQRVVEAPLDLTLPRWETDATFDLDYHVRRHSLSGQADFGELLRLVAPVYTTPFDRTRPLWEARIYDGLRDGQAAMLFKLHHAVADGVGGNAIFAAMTDWGTEAAEEAGTGELPSSKGAWPELPGLAGRMLAAMRDRVELDLERARSVAGHVAEAVQHPETVLKALEALRSLGTSLRFRSQSPLKHFGRSRRLSGVSVPFEDVRKIKTALGGTMIDVILTVMARAIGRWHKAHRLEGVSELMTLVPVNLRKPEEWAQNPHTGNVATGILVPLPIGLRGALATYREIRTRVAAKKADPASAASPLLAEVMSVLPRQFFTWMTEASFGTVDYIVTNVPGILAARYLAGAEITAAYPFAPVAMKSPVSIALYGYRDQLFVGITSDEIAMPDVDVFKKMILASFDELRAATTRRSPAPSPRSRRRKKAS